MPDTQGTALRDRMGASVRPRPQGGGWGWRKQCWPQREAGLQAHQSLADQFVGPLRLGGPPDCPALG